MYRSSIALLLLVAVASPAWAGDATATAPGQGMAGWSTKQQFFFYEGLAAFNSAAAAANPRITGGVILVTVPLGFAESRGALKEDIVDVTGYAAIGVYDTTRYPTVYSRPRAFTENFVAWNLWGGLTLLMEKGDSDGTGAKLARHMSVAPEPYGGVHVDLHWTF